MKSITITQKNAKWVFSRLEKFFRHKHFLCWHQFSGGMKKRIGHTVEVGGYSEPYKVNVTRPYYNVEIRHYPTKVGHGLIIDLNSEEALDITPGDTVAFLGNRIILKEKYGVLRSILGNTYCYHCFQILK